MSMPTWTDITIKAGDMYNEMNCMSCTNPKELDKTENRQVTKKSQACRAARQAVGPLDNCRGAHVQKALAHASVV